MDDSFSCLLLVLSFLLLGVAGQSPAAFVFPPSVDALVGSTHTFTCSYSDPSSSGIGYRKYKRSYDSSHRDRRETSEPSDWFKSTASERRTYKRSYDSSYRNRRETSEPALNVNLFKSPREKRHKRSYGSSNQNKIETDEPFVNIDWFRSTARGRWVHIFKVRVKGDVSSSNGPVTKELEKSGITSRFTGSTVRQPRILTAHTLTIHAVKNADAGDYNCVASFEDPGENDPEYSTMLDPPATLAVYDIPKPNLRMWSFLYDDSGNPVNYATEGNQMLVDCVYPSAVPAGTMVLIFNGTESLACHQLTERPDDSTICRSTLVAHRNDNGVEWLCATTWRKQTYRSPEVKLDVRFSSKSIRVFLPPSGLEIGSKVAARCETDSAHPAANISWRKDSIEITAGTEYEMKTSVQNGLYHGEQTISVLTFDATEEQLWGIFQCYVKGLQPEVASEGATLKGILRVKVKGYKGALAIGDDLRLACEVSGAKSPTFTWTFTPSASNQSIHMTNGKTLWKRGLTWEDEGNYTCEVSIRGETQGASVHVGVVEEQLGAARAQGNLAHNRDDSAPYEKYIGSREMTVIVIVGGIIGVSCVVALVVSIGKALRNRNHEEIQEDVYDSEVER